MVSPISKLELLYDFLFESQVAILVLPVLAFMMFKMIRSLMRYIGLTELLLLFLGNLIKWMRGTEYHVEVRKQEALEKLSSSTSHDWRIRLPKSGLPARVIIDQLSADINNHSAWEKRYSATDDFDRDHLSLIKEAYSMFAHTRLVHSETLPSVTRFEKEVVKWTANLFAGEDENGRNHICGSMTSGGEESIFLAVKSARDNMKMTRGIKNPEMIIPDSAVCAYDKAAAFFKVKLRRIPITKEFAACVEAMGNLVNKNTILIVGSAPCFPHGIIDPIKELGELALSFRICLHVDLCYGGFVLPFARKMARCRIPSVDFSVQGVTSMSVDLDKYGLAPEGINVVLFKNQEIRMHESAGGPDISPTISRNISVGLIAGTWATIMSLGEQGYFKIMEDIMDAATKLKKGIEKIRDIFILGKPEVTIIAFGSNKVDLLGVCEGMKIHGWHLKLFLQRPNSVHICVTRQHVGAVEKFLKDLCECVEKDTIS